MGIDRYGRTTESRRDEYWRNRNKIRARAQVFYQNNKESVKARVRKWALDNPERARRRSLEYRAARRRELADKANAYYYKNHTVATAKNREHRKAVRIQTRKASRERSEAVTEVYAREQLSKYSLLSAKDWPKELVELKQIHIKLRRKLKLWQNRKTSKNSATDCLKPMNGSDSIQSDPIK